jgi:hypothetical protein
MRKMRISVPHRIVVVLTIFGFIIATTLFAGSAGQALAQTSGGSWNYTGSLNNARSGHTATLLPNGKVLVVGDSPVAELYDPSTGKWSITGSPNVGGCATLLPTGKVLFVGDGRAEVYDPETGTFTITGNMTEQASCYTATLLPQGKVLITAFFFSNGPVSATPELYDPSTGTFTSTGRFVNTAADQLFDYTTTLLPNGKVLIAVPIAQLYDPVSGTFSLTGPMIAPFERYGRTATLLRNGKVLLSGGADDFGRHRNAELYDPSSGTFTATGDMNIGRAWHTATLLPDGTVLIAGGETEDCTNFGCTFAGSTASAEIFDPSTGTFRAISNMNARREVHTATLLNNGRVLIAGGIWYAGIGAFRGRLASTELYDSGDASTANPIDDPQFFVRQQYLDFLNREPDPLSDEWLKLINSCAPGDPSCDRIHVSEAFFKSDEFGNRGYFVWRFYPVSFPNVPGSDPPAAGHKPDFNEFVADLGSLSGFLTEAQLEAAKAQFAIDFTQRPAFVARYGPMNNADFVNTLCSTAGVTLSNQQLLIDALNSGSLTRPQVLRQIVESQGVYDKYYNEAFVVMQYFGYLRRNPDALYFDWIKVLDANPADSRHMIDGFVNSIEYRRRFGP